MATTKLTAVQRKACNLRRTAGWTFYVSAAVTASANMYASQHTIPGLLIGLWTPVAFFLSLELIERMPLKGSAGRLRIGSIAVLALIAGWTSYWHLVHVLREAGVVDPISLYCLPLTVDVLMMISRMAMGQKAPSPAARSRRPVVKATGRRLKAV